MNDAPASIPAMSKPPASALVPPSEAPQQREDNVFCLSTPWDVCVPCNACFVVPERANYVQLQFGKYHGTITEPGCYCRSSFAVELRRVGTDIVTYDLPNTKVLDATGSPIVISGIITYAVTDARAAAIDVNDPHRFVRDQAPAVLKRVVSQFPYESQDPNEASLRTETSVVSSQMKEALQIVVAPAGVTIDRFSINELSYAPEIAQAMLKRQQADALVNARRAIVKGASEIAEEAMANLPDGITPEQRTALYSNLLVVLVGDKDVTPTLQV